MRWGLSLRGHLVAGAVVAGLGLVVAVTLHPFLAVTARQPAEFLVVEGWIDDQAMRVAAQEFFAAKYQHVFTTGGPVYRTTLGGNGTANVADLGARKLQALGVPAASVLAIPAATAERDRTYASAVALRVWLRTAHPETRSVNVLTVAAHARRTQLLFQRACGDTMKVGVISVPNPDYDARRWWRYSEGVREVLGETIAYLYAKFFFFPPAPSAAETQPSVSSRSL